MLIRQTLQPFVVFEVSDPAGGGGAVGTAPAVQPSNGQGSQASENGNFWNLFPNVPQEHQALLEPHIREMQGYVTQLESQLAPFKAFAQAGLSPEATQGLLQFSNDFDSDPRGMWIRIGEMLQESGEVDPELDLEYLAALASGQDPEAQGGQQPPVANGQVQETGENAVLVQQIQALEAQIQELKQQGEQERARRTEAIQDQLLEKRMSNMREELQKAGWPEELLTDEALTAQIMAHRGNIASATKSMVDQRSGILKSFTENRQPEGDELELPNGAPPVPGERSSVRDKNDPWAGARGKATQRLRQANRARAQS